MGYHQGEGVLDCTYCEEDVLEGAKANIRSFIETILGLVLLPIALVLGLLVGTLSCIGGCFGCEACVETAECADEMLLEECFGCDFSEWTEEGIDNADDCVSCEGIDCFGRQGCFSCESVGDCDSCKGTVYYNFTVSYEGNEQSYSIEEGDYFYGYQSNEYYRFLGLYGQGGKQFVNEEGEFVATPRQGMTLYPRFEEYNLGQTYTFDFHFGEFGGMIQTASFQVGSSMVGLPVAPAITGYQFMGWYMNGTRVIPADATDSRGFHLSDFRIDPDDSNRYFMVTAEYEPIDCRVNFVIYLDGNSNTCPVTVSYGETFAVACEMLKRGYGDVEQYDWFFGWGLTPSTDPENKITPNTVIESGMTVYAIARQAVYVNFHYTTANGEQTVQIKLREGQTDVRFSRLAELEGISDEGTYPGYQFLGWYKTSYVVDNEQSVDSIPLVSTSITKDFYARYQKATYIISYYVTNYASGTTTVMHTQNYTMQSSARPLYDETYAGEKQPGYDYIGWRLPNGDIVNELPAYTYGNIDVYAEFRPHSYTLYLNSTPDSIIPGSSSIMPNYLEKSGFVYGSSYTLPVPTRSGYTFKGWYLESDSTKTLLTYESGRSKNALTMSSLGYPPTVEAESALYSASEGAYVLTMKAAWEVQTYMVTFMKDGSRWADQVVVNNGKVDMSKISEPTKDGYDFKGWVYQNSGVSFNEAQSITSNITLEAKFEIKKFTVTFMIEGAENGTQKAYPVYNVEWNKTLADAVAKISGRPNDQSFPRRLVGWYTSASYQTQMRETDVIRSEVTVYAKFEYARQFTFDAANATYYYIGDTVTFPTATEKMGYEFKGCCADKACQTTPIFSKIKLTDSTARDYYAKYVPISYTITYQYEDGSFFATDSYTIEDVEDGARPLIGANEAPAKTGYTFAGWREKNAYGALTGGILTSLNTRIGNVTLVAQYTANTYKVTLKNEGNNEVKDVVFDGAFNFGVPAEKEGYHFIGWSWTNNPDDLATDSKGKSLAGKNYAFAVDTPIYPMYAVNSYAIYWRNAETNALYVTTYADHFSTLTRGQEVMEEGCTFAGWYTDRACQNEYAFNTNMITGEVTLYAKFTPNDYVVTFTIGSGIEYKTTLKYGASLAEAMEAAMVKVREYEAAYAVKFVHWEDTKGRVVYGSEDTVPAGGLTLQPKFYYPVTVEFWDGNQRIHVSEVYYYGDSIEAYTYAKTGYTFAGWYTDGSLNADKLVSFPVKVEDVSKEMKYTYYARWTPNTYTLTYYVDGNRHTSENITMDKTEVYGGYALMVKPTEEKKGYVFEGWYLSSDFSGERITSLDNSMGSVQNPELYNGGEIKLYGKWVLETYTITLMNANGSVMREIEVRYGEAVESLPVLENMANKYFNGWKRQDTNERVANQFGVWLDGTYQFTEDVVLVADWYED